MLTPTTALRARSLQHVRPVVPLLFPSSEPESERMGQRGRHFLMRKALYEILRAAARDEAGRDRDPHGERGMHRGQCCP